MHKAGRLKLLLVCAASVSVSACGGSSGGAPAPAVAPAAPPVTPPTPPPPTSVFNTPEYQRTNGLDIVQPIPAYEAGATGEGVTIGIVDSGIDLNTSEFTGRVLASSRDVFSNRSLQDPDGHGTLVAAVAAGARNAIGTHGVAFDANLLIARADNNQPCGDDGCSYLDDDIADGIDLATSVGARVVNLSLGGSPANARLAAAVRRATAAGVIVVVSAGNDSNSNPDSFPVSIANASSGSGLILIVGAQRTDGTFADFSNAAGDYASIYLTAPGDDIRATGINGQQLIVSGTSFSAPHVSGALALLAEAFPTLTSRQLVDLLLSSATDLGSPGQDRVFGHGGLNIARAFQPQGATRLAGTTTPVSLDQMNIALGGALGNGAQLGAALRDVVVLDRFNRAFAVNLGNNVRAVTSKLDLARQLQQRAHIEEQWVSSRAALRLTFLERREATTWRALGLAETPGTRTPLGGHAAFTVGRRTQVAAGLGVAPQGLLAGITPPAPQLNFVADQLHDPFTPSGANGTLSFAATSKLGPSAKGVRVSMSASAGTNREQRRDSQWALRQAPPKARRVTVRVSHTGGRAELGASFGFGKEERSLLGTTAASSLALPRKSYNGTLGLDASVGLVGTWQLALAGEVGMVKPGAGSNMSLVSSVDRLATSRFSAGIIGADVLTRGDRLGIRVSQPLRVESGGLNLSVPVGYDVIDGIARLEDRRASLAPSGREIALEAAYRRRLFDFGMLEASLFRRSNPGHTAGADSDTGGVISWSTAF